MPVRKEEILPTVRAFIRENYIFDDAAPLHDSDSLVGSGTIDSTGILELISFLERTYHLTFDDRELVAENFDTIDRLSSFIHSKLLQSERRDHDTQ